MTVSVYDIDNLESILEGHGDWFDAHLYRFLDQVLFKADRRHWLELWKTYPEQCKVIYLHYGWSENDISDRVKRMLNNE